MEEEEDQSLSFSEVVEEQGQRGSEEENVVQFLDSLDSYLTLFDSLSSTLRQGWLELASARHSMGVSRINGTLLDLKPHSAATTLQVSEPDVDYMVGQPHFKLSKWASSSNENCCSGEEKIREDKLQTKSDSPQLRHRSQFSGTPATIGAPLIVDDQVQKERSKSLSMFGTLVSPKLRSAQLSFETALETLVEIANMRSTMFSTSDQIRKEMAGPRDDNKRYCIAEEVCD
ncbi:coiled-coil domain-containing protein 115 [Quercus lobata]|uniref:Vacuolar ATPase assembly protein VMA22 n=1 Tax=Quercus lobata TaxID=97700 RepID=A0A7N2KTT0_QUELO|nr:coiled-coil domain-containing protein 115 [Quercus lobata]